MTSPPVDPPPGAHYPRALARHTAALAAGRLLHVVNYHVTPPERGAELERQLAGYLRHFDPVLPEHLDAYFATGRWPLARPGFAACFFDAHREHVLAAEVCESLGIAGWFLPVTGFMDCPVEEQAQFCEVHDLWLPPQPHPDGRIALTWDELGRIAERHVIGAHTATHAVPDRAASAGDAQRELLGPARRLAELSGRHPAVLAWRLGLPHDPAHPATAVAVDAGYRYLLSATLVQRIA
jgi:hypothetical protein